jgi:hypothetical protein
VEADFRQFYGLDFVEAFWSGGCTIRQVLVYIKRLPRTSRLAEHFEPRALWSPEAYLLADAVDVLQVLVYLTQMVNTGKDDRDRVPKPVAIRRPGQEAAAVEEPKLATMSEARAFLSAIPRAGDMVSK